MPHIAVSRDELEAWRRELEGASPEEIILWAWGKFRPKIVATSSFQSQSVPLLYLISRVAPDMPVVFLDTGYHFPETLQFMEELRDKFGLNVVVLRPSQETLERVAALGGKLYETDPDLCCRLHKIEPLERYLSDMDAWLTGIRRDQTEFRSHAHVVEKRKDGLIRVNPILSWTSHDIWRFINRHDLPVHPLLSKGYMSIGCEPCTRPVTAGEGERAGRWAGTDKIECGIHTYMMSPDEELSHNRQAHYNLGYKEGFSEGNALLKKVVSTDKAPTAVGAYSQAIIANGFVFVSGQLGIDPATGEMVDGGIEAQTRQALENIQHILDAAGTSMENVVKTTVYLLYLDDFTAMNRVYLEFFPDASPPARSTVPGVVLPLRALVEIEAIAVMPD